MLVVPGQCATFTINATGSNLMYQWQKNGVNITTKATSATYTIAAVAESDEGEYRCVVSNAANSVTSTAASLTVCKLVHHMQRSKYMYIRNGTTYKALHIRYYIYYNKNQGSTAWWILTMNTINCTRVAVPYILDAFWLAASSP